MEHQLQIRQLTGIRPQELHDPPECELFSRLVRRPELVQIDFPLVNHYPEMRSALNALQHLSRDSIGLPGPEILVDPPEVLGTYLGVYVLGLVFQGIIQGACLLHGCVRTLKWELGF